MAANYGVPQKRRRLFFVASKNLDDFNYPEPTHGEQDNILGLPRFVGAGEALSMLPKAKLK